jgi:hypothetical protein
VQGLCQLVQVTGEVTYNGHTLDEFFPQRTASYVEQTDQHIAELTVGLASAGLCVRNTDTSVAYGSLSSARLLAAPAEGDTCMMCSAALPLQVHETFDFAAKCQGVGHKHGDILFFRMPAAPSNQSTTAMMIAAVVHLTHMRAAEHASRQRF